VVFEISPHLPQHRWRFARAPTVASVPLRLVTVFDDLLTKIPFALDAPRAASLVVEIRLELD
jgi:hypothetical protein